MVAFLMIICFAMSLIGLTTAGIAAADLKTIHEDAQNLKNRIDTLRLKIDAHETILAEEMAKNEDLKYRLIDIQNAYVRIKRDNENVAHKLMRGEINENDEKAG